VTKVEICWLTAFIDRPMSVRDASVEFWAKVTGATLSTALDERDRHAVFTPADGEAFLGFTTVPARGGCRFDLHVDDVRDAAARAVGLGAVVTLESSSVRVASPAGLRFRLVPAAGHQEGRRLRRCGPVIREDGSASLVDQLCLDIPASAHEMELAFWQGLTGGVPRPAGRAEFHVLATRGLPLRLLLQRLDDDPPDGRARCHLDVACKDGEREVALHLGWGATVLARHPWWTTLTDPGGFPYCVVAREPV
jgi:predicted enzyme related to lactoylglutathione lyase